MLLKDKTNTDSEEHISDEDNENNLQELFQDLDNDDKKKSKEIVYSYFETCVELVDELKTKRLTYVGTMRKNKREVPLQFQPNKQRRINSSVSEFIGDLTLVSFVPKKNRSVIML